MRHARVYRLHLQAECGVISTGSRVGGRNLFQALSSFANSCFALQSSKSMFDLPAMREARWNEVGAFFSVDCNRRRIDWFNQNASMGKWPFRQLFLR
jgi:hypothetical protein